MTTRYCPDCLKAVTVSVNAREGRCAKCRPQRTRRHAEPRRNVKGSLDRLIAEHRVTQ